MALYSSSVRHRDTWSGLCIKVLGGDAMDLVKDRLLEGVAGDDHEATGVLFFFSDSVTTAVWVGVWRSGQGMTMSMRVREARVALQGGRAQEMDAYKTSLVNNRGLDEEERRGNSEDREESKGWRRLQALEAAPFCTALLGRAIQAGGRVRSRVLGQTDVLSLVDAEDTNRERART